MYKDKEKAKAASKARMRKMRQGVTKGVTSQGVTGQGVTPISYKGIVVPEFARILPLSTIKTVLAALHGRRYLGLFDDSEKRWKRAVSWYHWDKAGRPVPV